MAATLCLTDPGSLLEPFSRPQRSNHHGASQEEPQIPHGIASRSTKPLRANDIARWMFRCRVVAPDPLIQVGLQLGDRAVDPLAERDPVELVQHRLVEALNDAVRLWAFGLGAGVIHIL